MKTKTIRQFEESFGVSLNQLLTVETNTYHSSSFRVPPDAGKCNGLSREMSLFVNAGGGSVLIVEHTGVWPSSENMYLAERFRHSFGEVRPIAEAPVHEFTSDDLKDCWSMFSLCLFNFWDFVLFARNRQILIRGSHDECLTIYAGSSETLEQLNALMRRLGMDEVQPSANFDEQISERVMALNQLRQQVQNDLKDSSMRQLLARTLHEIIVDLQELPDSRFLDELRWLAAADSSDAKVREIFAAALDSTLYYAIMAGRPGLVASPLDELRRLVQKYPADTGIRGVFAQGLVRVLQSPDLSDYVEGPETLLRELEKLALQHPQDPEVQQWLSSARKIR